jgi:hypothetical protein
MKLVNVTPEMAREWLENNLKNRPLRGDKVKAHARDMRNEQWRMVGDPIRIDTKGNLADGQHRLSAVVESGVTVPFWVLSGIDPDDKIVIDSGTMRRAGDQLVMDGRKYGVRLAAGYRLIRAIEIGRPYDGSFKITNPELFATADENPGLLDSLLATDGLSRQIHTSPTNAMVVHYLGTKKIPTTTFAYFAKLHSGANMAATDPALLFRNRMTSGYERPTGMAQLWMMAKGLVNTKDDVQATSMQLPKGSRVTPDRVVELVNKILSYRDERLEINN